LLFWWLFGSAIAGCGDVPIRAQDRLFAGYQLEFLDEYRLTGVPDTVGGLSAISFDPREGKYYALSDDRSQRAPARVYTLDLKITPEGKFAEVAIEGATTLKDPSGETVPFGRIDPEGLSVAPGGTWFIASEGVPSEGVAPLVAQFVRASGEFLRELPLPPRYLPAPPPEANAEDATAEPEAAPARGVRENLGFEALTLGDAGRTAPAGDPYRVFVATEGAIAADKLPASSEEPERLRLLHYLMGPMDVSTLIAEHLYLLDPAPFGSFRYGLSELLAIPPAGHFLALERSYGLGGYGAKLFEVVIANATDTSRVESLGGELGQLVPVQKQLVLNFSDLGLKLDNLEGMTLGPRLADGSQSLIFVSDNNFSNAQFTQLLLFRLSEA